MTILSHPRPSPQEPLIIAFLSRHGLHHELAPHEVPSRANIATLRKLGVKCVLAFSAVGSLREEVKPRDFLVPDQVFDRTKGVRPWTFFEGGVVGHVGFADPFDNELRDVVVKAVEGRGVLEGENVDIHSKGTLVCMGTSILLSVRFMVCFWLSNWQKNLHTTQAVLQVADADKHTTKQKDHSSLLDSNLPSTVAGAAP